MKQPTVLISGAGVAGPTLAFWLARQGFRPTAIERSAGQRSSGNPVDVRAGALRITGQMGVTDELRAAATHVSGLTFRTATGRRIGPLPAGRSRADEVEVPRADLAAILHGAARDHAEFRFDDSIVALHQEAGGVDVTFATAPPGRFDLVIGADGLHSAVRGLVFDSDAEHVHHLGMYVATCPLGRPADDPNEVVMRNAPGRSVSVHPVRGNAIAAFIFRSPAIPGLDHRDTEAHRRVVLDTYRADGIPELLDDVRRAPDLYFDSVSRVTLPSWSSGRVALVGDAAASLSLFGDGSSLAITGAFTLAGALGATPEDHARAFRAYESRHRAAAQARQRGYLLAKAMLVPGSRASIAVRDLLAWPLRTRDERVPKVGGETKG